MLCLIKKHIGFIILSSCFLSLLSVSSSYAVDDISVTKTRTDTQWLQGENLFPTCTDSNCLGQYKYLIVHNTSTFVGYNGQTILKLNANATQNYISTRGYAIYDLSLLASPVTEVTFVNALNPSYILGTDDTISFILTNTLVECPVCPEISDHPYDSKFDEIIKAIYTCGAVLLVLYFFFSIYQVIIKGGSA